MFIPIFAVGILLVIKPIFSVISIDGIALTEEDYNVTWIYFPDGKNNLQIALLVPPKGRERVVSLKSIERNVKFILYTRETLDNPVFLEIPQVARNQNMFATNGFLLFDRNIPTKILIHGWMGNTNDPIVQLIKTEYLKDNFYNIIAVDWSYISTTINYFSVASNVPNVGKVVANLINYLEINLGVDPKSIHLIGHSLGAHVSGNAGHFAKLKIGRITGLDPAKPLFEGMFTILRRLNISDADFVDVLHTCAYFYGISSAIGHVDFYPNGGSPPQPGCLESDFSCSHGRAYLYFAESIRSEIGFWSYPCDNYTNFQAKRCLNDPILMGNNVPNNASGTFYLKTRSMSTYAAGILQINEKILKYP